MIVSNLFGAGSYGLNRLLGKAGLCRNTDDDIGDPDSFNGLLRARISCTF